MDRRYFRWSVAWMLPAFTEDVYVDAFYLVRRDRDIGRVRWSRVDNWALAVSLAVRFRMMGQRVEIVQALRCHAEIACLPALPGDVQKLLQMQVCTSLAIAYTEGADVSTQKKAGGDDPDHGPCK